MMSSVRAFPWEFDSVFGTGSDLFVPDHWTINEPVNYVVWQEMSITTDGFFILGQSGAARINPDTLDIIELALDN